MSEVHGNWRWRVPPPILNFANYDEVHVWRLGLEWPPDILENYRQLLTEDEQKRAARFYFERDRHRFTAGRAILRSVLGYYLNESPTGIEFEYGPQGKPALGSKYKGQLEFNLSHSHHLGLLAVTPKYPVGIDIEYPKENIAINDLVKRFFAPEEAQAFQALPAGQQREAFFNAWTRKEAYLKACGGGLSIGLDRVLVTFKPGQVAQILKIDGSKEEAARWSMAALQPFPGYQAALVVNAPDFSLKCWTWQTDYPL